MRRVSAAVCTVPPYLTVSVMASSGAPCRLSSSFGAREAQHAVLAQHVFLPCIRSSPWSNLHHMFQASSSSDSPGVNMISASKADFSVELGAIAFCIDTLGICAIAPKTL